MRLDYVLHKEQRHYPQKNLVDIFQTYGHSWVTIWKNEERPKTRSTNQPQPQTQPLHASQHALPDITNQFACNWHYKKK